MHISNSQTIASLLNFHINIDIELKYDHDIFYILHIADSKVICKNRGMKNKNKQIIWLIEIKVFKVNLVYNDCDLIERKILLRLHVHSSIKKKNIYFFGNFCFY